MKKLFYLAINKNDDGFSATVEINEFVDRGDSPSVEERRIARQTGGLPSADSLYEMAAKFWEQDYQTASEYFKIRGSQEIYLPIVDDKETDSKCRDAANQLIERFCDWLSHPDFAEVTEIIQREAQNSDENRIVLTTYDPQLFKLPWRKWEAIADLPNTLVSIGSNEFQRVEAAPKDKNRILILLGHDANDGHAIAFTKLENDYRDRLEFVKESPETLDELSNILADAGGWDILLFIGHGRSENNWQTGEIEIASGLKVVIEDLQAPFKQAIAQGLRLVILNCCDGLGLAHQLGMGQKLHLPHTIVMQDLFPVRATAQFLEYFLDEFTQYQSLDVALSNTQTKLEQELEQDFPCVSLLPYLWRNPSSKALTWLDLVGLPECPYGDLEKPRLEFAATDWAGLERGIMAPADRFGVYAENGLVELVLQDIGIAPNSSQSISTVHLALLELVFRHIWLETAARKRIYLAIATYQDLGLAKILGDYAEQVYQRLEPQYGEARLQRIFTQLVDPQTTGNDSCRTAIYEEIGEAKDSELVLNLYASGLLLSINDGIEVVHEALVWGWQRLKDWVNHADNRLFLVRLKQLRNEVAKWDSQERKPKYLLQGSPLDDVRGWLGRSEMTAVELDFIGLSLKRRDRQLKWTIFGVTGGLIVALGLAGVATWQWQLANQKTIEVNQERSNAVNTAASLLIENLSSSGKPFEALIEAIRTAKRIQQEKVEVSQDNRNRVTIALSKLVYTTKEINRLEVIEKDEIPISGVGGVTFSPDGKIIASYSSSKIRLWNLDGSLLKEISLKEPNKVISTNGKISFSPDGKLIALGVSIDNIDPSNPTKVFSGKSTYGVGIWDLEGNLVRILDGHSDFTTAKFSPNGQTIVSSSYDKTTKIWNIAILNEL